MEVTMLVARPSQAFRIGLKKVVVCHVAEANPNDFLGKELWIYREGRRSGRIKIEGVSTATPNEGGPFDFSYSGDEIRPEQLDESSLLSDGRFEEAIQGLDIARTSPP
jgi:hypothetical protein